MGTDAAVGVVVVACLIEFGLARVVYFLRWRLLTPGSLVGLWMLLGLLGVPAAVYLVMGGSRRGPGPGVALLVALVSFPILILALGRKKRGKLDQLERDLLEKQQTRAWRGLTGSERRQVKRCARRGELHPDALIAQISVQWASDYLTRHEGLGWLQAKIVRAAQAAPRVETVAPMTDLSDRTGLA